MAKKRNINKYLHLDENPLVSVGNFFRDDTRKLLEVAVTTAIKNGDLTTLRKARAMQKRLGFIG